MTLSRPTLPFLALATSCRSAPPPADPAALSLIAVLGDSVLEYEDSLVAMRHRYLQVQLGSTAVDPSRRRTPRCGGHGAAELRAERGGAGLP